MSLSNPITTAPATFAGIVDTAIDLCGKYRSGALDAQYYGNYSCALAAVADTFRQAAAMIAALK
jgi:hypothetical protein